MLCLFFLGCSLPLYSFNPIFLGLSMFICSVSLALLTGFYFFSWFALIFFLVFVGGLLVLMFYILSLSFNPLLVNKTYMKGVFLILMCFLVKKSFSLDYSNYKKFSVNLFKFYESSFCLFVIGVLLFVLWVVSKIIFKVHGTFRPLL